ncbi:hypothetical protein HN51_034092 [Arachis hypogaea]|uniref:LTI65/LTI78 PGEED repeat domain-containing protein n=1 Tax=Arachis hypogaea TaxID=3818 RepID=A0A445A9I7_ARAHY|nr:probable serine/threonine-protein kinase dyrk2 isoform X1 [Arachis ipaensis]XP_025642005.1 probable serine/threonine-protein kinase dyrk2 isoform X1 [Arachis hypogaea]RYR23079.1 hypothetical protein Ahy_B03g068352 [Arachis hypogaea]
MAQLERPQRPGVETSKTPTIHTMEQLLRGEGSKVSPKGSKLSPTGSKMSTNTATLSSSSTSSTSNSSPFFNKLRHHDSEEDHSPNQKKSVLAKVKEKAKKLRHSLSKKKHDDGNQTPSPSSGLEDEGTHDEAEYHGAPSNQDLNFQFSEKVSLNFDLMLLCKIIISVYESEKAHQPKSGLGMQEKCLTRSFSKRTTHPATVANAAAGAATSTNTIDAGSNRVATTRTLAHELNKGSHSMTSKFQGLTIYKPDELHTSTSPKDGTQSSFFVSAPSTPPKTSSQTSPSAARIWSAPVTPKTLAPVSPQTPSCSSAPTTGRYASPGSQIWDKGVSVKEYLMNKLEPGEDEKALSQVISEAMSPKRTPGDAGVMEKVREAVTSLLRTEEPKQEDTTTTITTTDTNIASTSYQNPVSISAARSSSQIPVSTNALEVVQEENHERILQAN